MAELVTTDTPVTAPAEGAQPIPGDVAELIRARVGERPAPLVERLFRSSLVLDQVPEPDLSGPVGEAGLPGADAVPVGWLGGLPALPAGTAWPEAGGRPMQLLAQLDCAALAAAFRSTGPGTEGWPLPAEGLLLFFHDEWLSDFTGRGCRVLHVPAGAPPRPAPAVEQGAPAVPAVPVRAAWALSAPSYQDRELERLFPDDFLVAFDLAQDLAERLPRPEVRLLGWCDTDTGRPEGHRPLLQIGSGALAVDWGECVNVSFWISEEDFAAGRLDQVRHGFEVA
ncbi:YwqG family protein [Kitasatospora purpeofusca]|uniref:YwqG family protein n=1 Tax=Kitasatospora purpeofusca TaxID=67352 RepID=A0ABZ1TUY6_9ACTN|nr:YwqG family protein [Kitasatospora purpeofusca]